MSIYHLYVGTTPYFDAHTEEAPLLRIINDYPGVTLRASQRGYGIWDGEPDPHVVITIECLNDTADTLASLFAYLTRNQQVMVAYIPTWQTDTEFRVRQEDTAHGNRTLPFPYSDKGWKFVSDPNGRYAAYMLDSMRTVTTLD